MVERPSTNAGKKPSEKVRGNFDAVNFEYGMSETSMKTKMTNIGNVMSTTAANMRQSIVNELQEPPKEDEND